MRYYDQHLADLDLDKTVLQELQDAFGLPEESLRTFLGRLLFSGDDAFKVIRSLSGGEKSRVALAKLMLDDPGLLLLDEPTNHLDIPAQEMLEEALEDYGGTVVFVSHDRSFIDALADRLWVIQDGAISMHLGNYADYERERQRAAISPPVEGKAGRPVPSDSRSRSATEPQPAAVAVEAEIDRLEADVREVEAALADPSTYDNRARVAELSNRHRALSDRLHELYEEWARSADQAEA
jgi:ATP-binding cassette subfamily F protein 3